MQCISHFMTLLGNGTTVMLTTCNIIQLDSGILISLGVAKTVIVMDWCNNHCAACVQPSLLCPFSNFECAFKDGNWTSPKLWRIAIFWAIQCNTVHSDNMTPTVLQHLTMAACVIFKLTSKCSSISGIYHIMWQLGLYSTVRVDSLPHRKWREIQQQPGTAGPGNMLGCCLIYSISCGANYLRAL